MVLTRKLNKLKYITCRLYSLPVESCLINCLNSIKIACKNLNFKFDVCISDNSNYSNSDIIKKYKKFFKIIYHKNKNNIGVSKNVESCQSF